jgi:predicted porin
VIEAIDNVNYSRSFLFNYSIPFTHTGLKMGYAFTDAVSASVHVVNGWDSSTDNNTAKTVGLSVYVAPVEMFSAYINYMQGPEQADNTRDNRSLLDLVATIKPIKPLSIILNYDTAKEEMGAGLSDVKWSGFAAIVKYDINDMYSISIRGESFDDKDGVRTGTAQKLTEFTLTPEIRLANGIILRPEYRHDSSDQETFDNGTKKTQDTVALGAMYRW